MEKAEKFGADILRLCVKVGGVLTGEHGVGIEKRDLMGEMFSEDDMKQQQRLKCAFDPEQQLKPRQGLSNVALLRRVARKAVGSSAWSRYPFRTFRALDETTTPHDRVQRRLRPAETTE